MLAPSSLPPNFSAWNRRQRAPFGRRLPLRARQVLGRSPLGLRARGKFAWQPNSTIRRFEYPWAFNQIEALGRSVDVVEIGGGLSGFQFALARQGHRVSNVDPGLRARGKGWALDPDFHGRLARAFKAPVTLVPETLGDAKLADDSVDVLLSISTLEHFAAPDLAELEQVIPRILRPDGLLVLTVDLFLDLEPFTDRQVNRYGQNIDIHNLLTRNSLELESGNPSELYGFSDFDAQRVQANLSDYLIGTYPALAQCFTARRSR